MNFSDFVKFRGENQEENSTPFWHFLQSDSQPLLWECLDMDPPLPSFVPTLYPHFSGFWPLSF